MKNNRRAKVVYSYAPQNDDELRLEVDEVIEVLDEIEEGWWKGISPKGITGVFPSNFVVEVTTDSPQINKKDTSDKSDSDSIDGLKPNLNDSLEKKPKPITKVGFGDIFAGGKPKLSPIGDSVLDRSKNAPKKPPPPTPPSDSDVAPKLPPKPVREQAKVLFGYEAQNEDELTIKEGEVITIIAKEIEDVGWWKGELNGRIALFPDNFVEILKTSEDSNSISRVKKPNRPVEKPPLQLNINPSVPSNSSKPETKISNKPNEELPKSVGSNSTSGVSTSAPVVPGKPKPKVLNSSLFQAKPKPEPTPTSIPSSVKPDVVPQENGSKHDKDIEADVKTNGNNTSDNNFASIESTGNKLTHLCAQRPKGPPSRRPPSTIFIPKETGSEPKENGDISVVSNKTDTNSNQSNEQIKTPPEKVEKLPPWMVELRRAQEKRKENPDDPPKGLHSPTKTSPNRFSGDFTNKSQPQQTPTPEEVFKPLKSTKPIIPNSAVTSVTSTATETPTTVSTSNISNKTTNIVISSATTTTPTPSTPPAKVEEAVNHYPNDKKEFLELKEELRVLRESSVSRKEFESLVKQVTELKEVVETQKQSYSKIIKDLINDVSDEKKKLATLQIECDRLRKLTTTV